jgi:transposase
LLTQLKQTGEIAPKPHGGGRRPSILVEGQTFIKELLENQPDLTLEEITNEYNQRFDSVGKSTIDRTLNKLKRFLQKKSLFDPRKNTPERKVTKLSKKPRSL